MAVSPRVKTLMKKNGLTAVNTPKRTPGHPSKSHVVMAYDKGTYKLVRFGQQGVKGSPKKPNESKKYKLGDSIGKKDMREISSEENYTVHIGQIR